MGKYDGNLDFYAKPEGSVCSLEDLMGAETLGVVLSRVLEDLNISTWFRKLKKSAHCWELFLRIEKLGKGGKCSRKEVPRQPKRAFILLLNASACRGRDLNPRPRDYESRAITRLSYPGNLFLLLLV